jgi:DNA-binding PadR family transcriptional regulator
MLKFALLGFLNYGPMTGYELKKYMDGSTANFWNAKLSQIYPALKNLEEDEWVRSSIQMQEEKPDKRVYTITAEGKQNLQKWLSEPPVDLNQHKDIFLLKLFFAAQIDKAATLALLAMQKNLHQRQADFYRNETRGMIQGILKQNPALKKDGIFWEATRRFGELFEETYVNWLNETIEIFEEKL